MPIKADAIAVANLNKRIGTGPCIVILDRTGHYLVVAREKVGTREVVYTA